MPHWDKASMSKDRSIQSVKVNDEMLPKVNKSINKMNSNVKPYNVSGYPSIILVDKQGNKITDINAVPTSLKTIMDKSASLATKANINNIISKKSQVESLPDNVHMPNALPMPMTNMYSPMDESTNEPANEPVKKPANEPVKKPTYKPNAFKDTDVVDPSYSKDDMSIPSKLEKPDHVGGSLYDLMAKTTYTLAPTLALLATAKIAMKKRTHKKSKRAQL